MLQVFISYRHVSPDKDLAGFLEGYLKSRGLDVFIDTQMLVGDKWVEEIERQIKASSFFIALLSADSIRSDMVRQEVELAHCAAELRHPASPRSLRWSAALRPGVLSESDSIHAMEIP